MKRSTHKFLYPPCW